MSQVPNLRELLVDEQRRPTHRWWNWFNEIPPVRFSGTVTTAKLTSGGANGSLVFVNGVLVSQTPAT